MMKKMRMRTKNNSSESAVSEKREGRLSALKALALPAAAVLLAVLLNLFFIVVAVVPSASMAETIEEDSLIFANRLAYVSSSPERGDVVLFKKTALTGNFIVKRIVALPGERIFLREGRVYINGVLLDEPYVTEFSSDSMEELTVPEGCYFVLGDNRNNSTDARFWDDPFVERGDIKARAILILFPTPGRIK